MKLNEKTKSKIDAYFDKIAPKELFDLSVRKYGFIEDKSKGKTEV